MAPDVPIKRVRDCGHEPHRSTSYQQDVAVTAEPASLPQAPDSSAQGRSTKQRGFGRNANSDRDCPRGADPAGADSGDGATSGNQEPANDGATGLPRGPYRAGSNQQEGSGHRI